MTNSPPVRPTKRALDDLGIKPPAVNTALHELPHPAVEKAQGTPAVVEAGGAERVLAIEDRVWFKVKIGPHRGAVTQLRDGDPVDAEVFDAGALWWLGAGGHRQGDSADDFYKELEAEVARRGKTTGSTSSEHLLPVGWDVRRLRAEVALQVHLTIKRVVREAIARSLHHGGAHEAVLEQARCSVCAWVTTREGEAYLAISAEGHFVEAKLLALILAAVPGVTADDWMVEPEGPFKFEPRSGQMVYSAIIPAEAQKLLLAEFDAE